MEKRVGQERLIQQEKSVGKKYPDFHPKKDPIGFLSFLALIEGWFWAFLFRFPY